MQPPCGQLNPSNPNLYKIMRDLFKDIIDIFPHGNAFHMGGDEVIFVYIYKHIFYFCLLYISNLL